MSVTSVGWFVSCLASHDLFGESLESRACTGAELYFQFVSVSQSVTDETGQEPKTSTLILLADGTKLSCPHIPRYTVELEFVAPFSLK